MASLIQVRDLLALRGRMEAAQISQDTEHSAAND